MRTMTTGQKNPHGPYPWSTKATKAVPIGLIGGLICAAHPLLFIVIAPFAFLDFLYILFGGRQKKPPSTEWRCTKHNHLLDAKRNPTCPIDKSPGRWVGQDGDLPRTGLWANL